MKDLKILILLFYYNRPRMVRDAFHSVFHQDYQNWELVVIDDTEYRYDESENVLRSSNWDAYFIGDPRCSFILTNDTLGAKSARGGSNFGRWANAAMTTSDADLCIMLCDDDSLCPGYLSRLNEAFQDENIIYGYSPLVLVDPTQESYDYLVETGRHELASGYLHHGVDVHPYCQVDSSQVCWRLPTLARFPHPQTSNLDASFYAQLDHHYGMCKYLGPTPGQFKGWFQDQLGKRPNPYEVSNE